MNFLLVPVIIACALGGTILILKLIQKIAPAGIKRDPLTSRIEKELTRSGKEDH